MYACPVFAHAVLSVIKKIQTVLNKFCREATDAHWSVKNSVLHGGIKPSQLPHSLGRYLRAAAGTPFPKKATEYSVRSAGSRHIGRKAHRSQKHGTRIVGTPLLT
ncbi:hypothetical protein EVAR_12687_1 [Eumeta japonica]|uniref:Uncharacterized protein n=1 Tax=Eumeta variegata TaxID=151549 RepID=A0A4C1UMH0_EUMVA|nr:hypothetical protein EVAR_12687_1 [Eumeta japonica]